MNLRTAHDYKYSRRWIVELIYSRYQHEYLSGLCLGRPHAWPHVRKLCSGPLVQVISRMRKQNEPPEVTRSMTVNMDKQAHVEVMI